MESFPTEILPSSPVQVETRKNVSLTESETGARQFVIHSDAFRFYTLTFAKREIVELNDIRALWELVHPGDLQWTNVECDANADEFETDSVLKWKAIDNNVYDYSIALKAKNPTVHAPPASNVLSFDPSYGFDVESGKILNVSDSEAMRRAAAATSDGKMHYGLVFGERSLAETLAVEAFWDYHYPGRPVSFNDPQLGVTKNYLIDSDFKWSVKDWDWIDYSFVIHEV